MPVSVTQSIKNVELEEEEEKLTHEFKQLPRERGWRTPYLYKFQGFWCQPTEIQAISSFQKHFQSKNGDVFLATIPKSGTTWLKALTFAILNRKNYPPLNSHPLLDSNPHDLVPFLEYKLYANNEIPDLSRFTQPRIFATHVPFSSLEDSIIKNSSCKIVYICRNPFDTFVSSWVFSSKLRAENLPRLELEDCFEKYCNGVIGFGPFWDHMLGYWKESKERPEKVLFLKYEDMKEDVVFYLKKIGLFLGCPFSIEEEKDGVIEDVAKLCSFEKLKELEVNKSGKSIKNFENKHLFRKGEVGDYMNYLSPSMVDKLAKVMEEKLGGSGLQFNVVS
ncbi:cytosolic sulfotransferase 15-like [Euphorbia lathyris]|uniref:cytosolic sulfotransferase 15-like n=1 Tax=Euphorbia lathyris TaxID=212925 RepID=UPI003313C236